MSLPLTEAWMYQSFHVCGGEGTTRRRRGGGGGVDSGPALYAPFQLLHRLQKRRNDFRMEISLHGPRRLA